MSGHFPVRPAALRDTWAALRKITPSRIGLRRTGAALVTSEVLHFDLACARAKDAVFEPLDADALEAALAPAACLRVRSRASDRGSYLRNPGLGRQLHPDDLAVLPKNSEHDLVVVVGDGLSARAALDHAPAVLSALRQRIRDLSLGPVVIARLARVALADEIAEHMGARAVAILLGERPGLTTPNSLGVYMTIAPRRNRLDSERNCISNIHDHGLPPQAAARKLEWLLREGLRLGLSGIGLKDRETDCAPTLPRDARAPSIEGNSSDYGQASGVQNAATPR